jgi:hypothetical protein
MNLSDFELLKRKKDKKSKQFLFKFSGAYTETKMFVARIKNLRIILFII